MNNKELKELIKIFESSTLSRIKLDKGDVTIELEKPTHNQREIHKQVAPQIIQESVQKEPLSKAYSPVKAPLVGTYYEAAAPDQPPFVRLGQTVNKGDTLFIIEAMKVMNEITAPKEGKIMAIHVKNADMVMYDQIIMEID